MSRWSDRRRLRWLWIALVACGRELSFADLRYVAGLGFHAPATVGRTLPSSAITLSLGRRCCCHCRRKVMVHMRGSGRHDAHSSVSGRDRPIEARCVTRRGITVRSRVPDLSIYRYRPITSVVQGRRRLYGGPFVNCRACTLLADYLLSGRQCWPESLTRAPTSRRAGHVRRPPAWRRPLVDVLISTVMPPP